MKLLTNDQRERMLKNGRKPGDHRPVVNSLPRTVRPPGCCRSSTRGSRTSPSVCATSDLAFRNSAASGSRSWRRSAAAGPSR